MAAEGFIGRAVFGHPPTRACFDDQAVVTAMVRVEAALAAAEADLGMISAEAAKAIAALEGQFSADPAALGEGVRSAGVPVPALVAAMRDALGAAHADWVHFGATSQDIVDTAFCLCFARALGGLEATLATVIDHLEEKASALGDTIMLGRTRTQYATPISAGLRVAQWAQPLIALEREAGEVRRAALRVQFSGASGSRSAVLPNGAAISRAMAGSLGLEDGPPWCTDRSGLLRLAGWLNRLVAALGKIARDVALSSRGEVAEMRAGTGGGSSTMPHKSNPVTAEALQALSELAVTYHSGLASAAVHAEERDGSMWSVEWALFPALFEVAGAALAYAETLVTTLTADAAAMQARIDETPAVLAEAAVFALSSTIGVVDAKKRVGEALKADKPFLEALAERTDFDWAAWGPHAGFLDAARAVADEIFAERAKP